MARRTAVAAAILFAACNAQQPEERAQKTADTAGATELAAAAFGAPLRGLSAGDLALFESGKAAFEEEEDVADGLGPVFNEASCVACHVGPGTAVGGSNGRLETRFGRRRTGAPFDPLAAQGGSLLQDRGIGAVADGFVFEAEQVPASANVVARRRTTPLFGLGLVDAVPDGQIRAIAAVQSIFYPEVAGRVAVVTDLTTNRLAVGRFGWKNGNPTLLQFSADAYLNEMGITSPLFPNENCPQGDCAALAHNPRPDLNDADGADVVEFANFMTFLAPPPRGLQSLKTAAGESVFTAIGCGVCHVSTLVTGRNAIPALDRKIFHPFSDFLLHDMGRLGDGIAQGAAGPREMRTAPLWGMRVSTSLLHDGRAATAEEAILAHDGQGARARDRFASLDRSAKAALLAFLDSL